MAKDGTRSKSSPDDGGALTGRPTPEANLTWLLHRAAQRTRAAMDELAEQHGIQLREYIVLSALGMQPLTQLELARVLSLDKTTLMLQIDRLEKKGLVVRRGDPSDRRARIPEATAAGRALQRKVEKASARVEAMLLAGFASGEQRNLRLMLCELIGNGEDDKGSCL